MSFIGKALEAELGYISHRIIVLYHKKTISIPKKTNVSLCPNTVCSSEGMSVAG